MNMVLYLRFQKEGKFSRHPEQQSLFVWKYLNDVTWCETKKKVSKSNRARQSLRGILPILSKYNNLSAL